VSAHVLPRRVYYSVFAALVVLTAITVLVSRMDLGPMNSVVALSIAVLKASLVVLFFMHVKYGNRLVWVFVGASVLWLFLLISITLGDYLSRGWIR
jgi:cytochrome c oxidase subunit 4